MPSRRTTSDEHDLHPPRLGDGSSSAVKAAGYLVVAIGVAWAAVLAYGDAPRSDAAGPAILLGIGFGLVTLHSVRSGSIRGTGRKIHRERQPATFWVAAVVWIAASVAMLAGGVWLSLGG